MIDSYPRDFGRLIEVIILSESALWILLFTHTTLACDFTHGKHAI